jgi:hypothetical protein
MSDKFLRHPICKSQIDKTKNEAKSRTNLRNVNSVATDRVVTRLEHADVVELVPWFDGQDVSYVCRAHNGRAVAHKYGFAGVRRAFKHHKTFDFITRTNN